MEDDVASGACPSAGVDVDGVGVGVEVETTPDMGLEAEARWVEGGAVVGPGESVLACAIECVEGVVGCSWDCVALDGVMVSGADAMATSPSF